MAISSTRPQALPPLRRVLIVGGGGREQALAWALSRNEEITTVWIAPGNGGPEGHAVDLAETDSEALVAFCRQKDVDLVVVGPEAPLAAGVADALRSADIAVFGPDAAGASSKQVRPGPNS